MIGNGLLWAESSILYMMGEITFINMHKYVAQYSSWFDIGVIDHAKGKPIFLGLAIRVVVVINWP